MVPSSSALTSVGKSSYTYTIAIFFTSICRTKQTLIRHARYTTKKCKLQKRRIILESRGEHTHTYRCVPPAISACCITIQIRSRARASKTDYVSRVCVCMYICAQVNLSDSCCLLLWRTRLIKFFNRMNFLQLYT